MNELEQEKRIKEIVAREIAYESMQFWRDDLKKILTAFAAELGKEQEAERSGGRVNSSAFWCDNRHVVDYEEAFNIERDLLAQNARLKRELAEAESVIMATRQASIEAFNRIRVLVGAPIEGTLSCEVIVAQKLKELHAQNLALSASCQRQKDALEKCSNAFRVIWAKVLLDGEPLDRWREAMSATNDALAETPDVPLWERVVEFLIASGCSNEWCEKSNPSGTKTTGVCDRCALLSTLQPDHQK